MEMMIWNVVLTALVGVMAFMIKAKFEELDRLGILLNKTREEVARDHITRAEVRSDMERLMERFDAGIQRLENKIDELAKSGRNAQR
jgi:hypothetical protein